MRTADRYSTTQYVNGYTEYGILYCMKSIQTVCITGVNGFLGTATATAFVKAGYRVVGIGTASVPAEGVPLEVLYYQVDITDTAALTALLVQQSIDVVYHLAGIKYVGVCAENPALCHAVNHEGTVSVLAAMQVANIPHIVFASTYAVYEMGEGVVTLTEDSPLAPATVYGATKVAAEQAIITAMETGKISTYHILRYGNVIGRVAGLFKVESMVDRIVAAGVSGSTVTVFGDTHDTVDGTIARDFVAIQDVVSAHLAVALSTTSGIFNIATGTSVTLRDIITAVEAETGLHIPVEIKPANPEPASVTLVSTKAEAEINWKATTPLRETITQLVHLARRQAD